MNGNIDSAFQKLREWYPQVVQDEKSVICFLLCSQRFIEYIKVGQSEDAVSFGSAEITKFYEVKSYADLLEGIVGLLAYKVPAASSLGYLLDVPQREYLADAVNAAVFLSTNPALKDPDGCVYSCLEKLLKQLTLCSLERRAMEVKGRHFISTLNYEVLENPSVVMAHCYLQFRSTMHKFHSSTGRIRPILYDKERIVVFHTL